MNNEPAFPCDAIFNKDGTLVYSTGISTRDYFAARAIEIIFPSVLDEIKNSNFSNEYIVKLQLVSAVVCYSLANAMMEARK